MSLRHDVNELFSAVLARLRGKPSPDLTPGARRLRRWLGGVGALVAFAWGFYLSSDMQKGVCSLPIGQPALSDACGAIGAGDRPTREGRLDWERLRRTAPGQCDALSAYIARYPKGELHDEAKGLLDQRRVSPAGPFTPADKLLIVRATNNAPTSPSKAAAHAAAMARAQQEASEKCQDMADLEHVKLVNATVTPEAQSETCDRLAGGFVCGFDAKAVCRLNEPVETCGVPPP